LAEELFSSAGNSGPAFSRQGKALLQGPGGATIQAMTSATRNWPGVQLGASPRASITLMKVAQALAVYDGMSFVTPDHIRELAEPVIAHRLAMEPQARFSGLTARGVVEAVLKKIPPPK
jgi:MoxR-like ATPase